MDQMSEAPGFPVSVNLLGSPWDTGSKGGVLTSSFGTNPGRSSKTCGDLQGQEASGLSPRDGDTMDVHDQRRGPVLPDRNEFVSPAAD